MDAFYIKKIVIKGLFGTKNVSWDLSSKVNILGGENGSGKSTILKSCYFILKDKCIKEADLAKLSEEISIEFVNGYKLNWNRLAYDSIQLKRNGNEKVLSYVDLSMGEKQLILILLMVCNTANDTCIFFMDEPDLGMHVEWKEILIRELNKLNPNMQMIVSTHAPSMVEGWYDNVKEVKQICYND